MATHKRTKRALSPLAREITETMDDLKAVQRRMKRLIPRVIETERLALILLDQAPGMAATNENDLAIIEKRVRGRLPRNRRRLNDDQLKERFAQTATPEYGIGVGAIPTVAL